MNAAIENWNRWGENFLNFAWPMLWQSSLLIVVVFALDCLLAKKIRASVRHALWIVVLLKLVLPPTLALPTSAMWWLWPAKPELTPVLKNVTVTYNDAPIVLPPSAPMPQLPPPPLDDSSWMLLASGAVSASLLLWLAFHWAKITGKTRRATVSDTYANSLEEARRLAGLRGQVRLRLVDDPMSPAVCGLFRPVILLPRALAETLSPQQLRAVLLHEAIHLRRGDVWMNCAQTLLQIAYWWHPLLWLANARMRRLREEAVDDAVMAALRDGADAYAPTLLEVAKFAFRRPLASLGLVGILESRSALRQRIERLVDFHPPRQARLGLLPLCVIFAFSAVALPMGQAPASEEETASPPAETNALPQQSSVLEGETNGADHTAVSNTSSGREALFRKLDQIQVDSISFKNLPLNEVIRILHEQSQRKDPEKVGINFVFDPNAGAGSSPVAIDPSTGLPAKPAAASPSPDATQININLALQDVNLQQVLNDVCLAADHPIKYSVEDYGIVFSDKETNAVKYVMRTFRVDPDALRSQLHVALNLNIPPDIAGNNNDDLTGIAPMAKKFFQSRGVNLDPPKALFFNDRLGLLFVYATPQDLGVIEQSILNLNVGTVKPPNARQHAADLESDGQLLYEMGRLDDARVRLQAALTLDPDNQAARYYLSLISQAKTAATNSWPVHAERVPYTPAGSGRDSLDSTVAALNPSPAHPANDVPQIHIKARFIEMPSAADIAASSSFPGKSAESGFGILTRPQMQTILHQLMSQKGVKEWGEPECTTLTGRQAEMMVGEIDPVVTNYTITMPPQAKVPSISPQIGKMQFGEMFDVVPLVMADGYTVSLTAIGQRTQFFGYAAPKGIKGFTTNYGFGEITLPVTLPAIEKSLASANALLYDGQTLVLFPQPEPVSAASYPDQKSRELVAAHIQKAEKQNGNKTLVVLVTVTLIDRAGNRFHSDDDMPFAPDAIPVQPQIWSGGDLQNWSGGSFPGAIPHSRGGGAP